MLDSVACSTVAVVCGCGAVEAVLGMFRVMSALGAGGSCWFLALGWLLVVSHVFGALARCVPLFLIGVVSSCRLHG